jgi:hypothetical protein
VDDASRCGAGGGACVACDSTFANRCAGGACFCGTGAACSSGAQCTGAGAAATCTCAGTWTRVIVDTGTLWPALRVDTAGGVHLGSVETDATFDPNLRYAYRPGGGAWSAVTVDSVGDVGHRAAIDVDAQGGVHLSYLDYTNAALKYATRPAGGAWSTTTVDAVGDSHAGTSLRVDAQGGVHIGYRDSAGAVVKVAALPPGGSWSATTVAPAAAAGWGTALDVDEQGGVHLAYDDDPDLVYAYQPAAGSFSTTTVDSVRATGVALRVDAQGGVHLGYHAADLGEVPYHAYRSGPGPWSTTEVSAATSPVMGDMALALDAWGGVHLGYYTNEGWNTAAVNYARPLASGGWSTTAVATNSTAWSGGAPVERVVDLDLDAQGGVHLSYLDLNAIPRLKYAYLPPCP